MAVSNEQNQIGQNDDQKDKNSSAPTSMPGSGGSPSAPSGRLATSSNGQAPSQSSGRFTNIKNYINANQGAGDRLAQGVNQNVNKQTAGQKDEATTQAGSVRQGIESANEKLGTGQGYQNQLNDTNFNAQDFANNKTQLDDFSKFRTNQVIDSQSLQNNLGNAQQAGASYQNALQNVGQQAATESGRFGMLKNAFAGQNPYSTGQQRLDQLFLQSGGNNGVQQIQGNIKNQQTNATRNLNQVNQYGQQIGDITNQAGQLAQGLQDKTTGMTNKYVSDIASTEGAVNVQRAADISNANSQWNKLRNQQSISKNFADTLGLNAQDRLFHVVDADTNINKFANLGPTELHGASQLANTDQRNYYDALGQLSGLDKSNYAIRPEDAQAAAVAWKTGNESVASQIAQQQLALNARYAGNDVATGSTAGGSLSLGGGGLRGRATTGNIKLNNNTLGALDQLSNSNLINTANNFSQYGSINRTGTSADNGNDAFWGLNADQGNLINNTLRNQGTQTATGNWGSSDAGQFSGSYAALLNEFKNLNDQGAFKRVAVDDPEGPVNGTPENYWSVK